MKIFLTLTYTLLQISEITIVDCLPSNPLSLDYKETDHHFDIATATVL